MNSIQHSIVVAPWNSPVAPPRRVAIFQVNLLVYRSHYLDSRGFQYLFGGGDNVAIAGGSMNSMIYRAVVGHHLPAEAGNLLVQGASRSEPIVRLS